MIKPLLVASSIVQIFISNAAFAQSCSFVYEKAYSYMQIAPSQPFDGYQLYAIVNGGTFKRCVPGSYRYSVVCGDDKVANNSFMDKILGVKPKWSMTNAVTLLQVQEKDDYSLIDKSGRAWVMNKVNQWNETTCKEMGGNRFAQYESDVSVWNSPESGQQITVRKTTATIYEGVRPNF